MKKDHLGALSLGLILLFLALFQMSGLKFLLPDFAIEDEMVVVEGFYQLSGGDVQKFPFFKYPGLIFLLLAFLLYPMSLLYNFKTLLHLQTFSDLKYFLAHPHLAEESIIYLGRLTSLFFGLASVWLFFVLFRPRIGTRASLLGSLFLVSTPAWLFSSSVLKNDSLLLFCLLLLLYACFGILERGRLKDYAGAGIVLGLCLALKYQVFALIPLLYSHLLHFSELRFHKLIFKKELWLSLGISVLSFFLLNPFQVLHLRKTLSSLGLELSLQSQIHPLLKASPLLWYHLPILFQLLCVFPLALGIIGYLIALPGFKFCPRAFGKKPFRLFISFPLISFFAWAGITKLGYPHLYLPFTPFFAVSAGLTLDQLFRKKLFSQFLGLVLVLGMMLTNLLSFEQFNRAQARIVYQSLDWAQTKAGHKEKALAFFPYRPLANSRYHSEFQFLPQFLLTKEWLSKNQPEKILVHQTYYLSYLDNPEIQTPDRTGFFLLKEGNLNYQLIKEWQARPAFVKIYQYLFPDFKYLSVGFYQMRS